MAILYETKTILYENIQNKNKLYEKKNKAKKCDSFIQKSMLPSIALGTRNKKLKQIWSMFW